MCLNKPKWFKPHDYEYLDHVAPLVLGPTPVCTHYYHTHLVLHCLSVLDPSYPAGDVLTLF